VIASARDWIAAFGDIAKFSARVVGHVFNGHAVRFLGETLRQAGILILGSALVIWGLAFILGLQCGIEGAYFSRAVGAPSNAGVFAAWCDLREIMPYAFGYMMSAKVGTGLVAEIGAMRISDEIDALEVMGINSLVFLCATRLLAAWLVLPFMYVGAVGAGFFASYLAVVEHGRGRARGGGIGDGKVDGAEHRARAPGWHGGDADLLGHEPAGADRRLKRTHPPIGDQRSLTRRSLHEGALRGRSATRSVTHAPGRGARAYAACGWACAHGTRTAPLRTFSRCRSLPRLAAGSAAALRTGPR
jgi:Permease MlaE